MTRGSVSNLRHLYLERQGEIAHLVIDRPERRNAFTEEMWPTLSALAEQAEEDDRIKVMVVRGADSTVFCAGADVSEGNRCGERPGGIGGGLGDRRYEKAHRGAHRIGLVSAL